LSVEIGMKTGAY